MSFIIRRRRFGHIAIASATATLLANLPSKVSAQQNKLGNIYGIKVNKGKKQPTDPENFTPELILTSPNSINNFINNVLNNALSNVPNSVFEISGIQVENSFKPIKRKNKALSMSPRERVTGCTALPDGTLVIASVASSQRGDITRCMFINSKSNIKSKLKKAIKITKFRNDNSTVESLLATKEGNLICVTSQNGGLPPFELARIDDKGEIVYEENPFQNTQSLFPEILPNERLCNLAQSPNGKIYATNVKPEGSVRLVEIDLTNKSPITGRGRIIKVAELSFKDKPLVNDVLSLAFSESGQLFALANLDHEEINSLFSVDIKTGEMKFERKFDADRIAFVRS
jgi:hypothetical protein